MDGGADGHGHIKQNVKKVKSSHSLSLSSWVLVWMVLVLRSGKITDAKIYIRVQFDLSPKLLQCVDGGILTRYAI